MKDKKWTSTIVIHVEVIDWYASDDVDIRLF